MSSSRHRTIPLLLAAALVLAACTGEVSESTTTAPTTTVATATSAVAAVTTTAAPAPTTTEAGPSAEEIASLDAALAVKHAFFVAFNSGDPIAVMDLFADDAEFADMFGASDPQWFEELLVSNIAQGTRYTPSDCSAKVDVEASGVVVSCPFVTHDILTIESGGPPVPFSMTMLITSDGIASYRDRFGQPDFNTVGVPFDRWMEQHHPDDADAVAFGEWESIEEAATYGTLRASYAAEWGQYLETNGCAYNEGC
jgi:hypothetical protein